ncbi:MAG: PPOX class F420-dependent oxidoreductase [Thermomicrobiales bacterium]
MSEPRAGVIPASHRDLLEAPLIAHLATTRPQGSPQSTPVWFDWDGTHLLIAAGPDSQKYRNLQRDPRLALSIVDPANPARYLEVRGRVTAVDADRDGSRLRAIIRKYTGADELPGLVEARVILVIEPVRTSSMG